MKIKIILLVCTSFIILSCKNEVNKMEEKKDSIVVKEDTIAIDSHTAKNSLDWQGTYKGVLPCADCEGIETAITLNADNTFSLAIKYLAKGDGKIFEDKGTFSWDKSGGIVSLDGLNGKPFLYKVGENILQQLDLQGNPIYGKFEQMYILKK